MKGPVSCYGKKTQEIVLPKVFLTHYKGHGLVRMWGFYLKKQLKILIFFMKEFCHPRQHF